MCSKVYRIKRIYEPVAKTDGYRVLVERLWPRGVTKAEAALHEWLKDVAPSPDLRRWYGHDLARWEEFTERYRAELAEKRAQIKGCDPQDIWDIWYREIPMGRVGETRELASLVAYLASEQASYITAQSIAVDGGWIKSLL